MYIKIRLLRKIAKNNAYLMLKTKFKEHKVINIV